MAAVKANAYGHGLIPCARALGACVDGLAVAICEEAIELREAGISLPLLVLQGPFDASDVAACQQHDLMPVIHNWEQLSLLEAQGAGPIGTIWLKVDTGMHRLGFQPQDVEGVLERLGSIETRGIVIMSHLAAGEAPESSITKDQLANWRELTAAHVLETSLLNSPGTISDLAHPGEWIRPGIMLYGAPPKPVTTGEVLRAVMGFYSSIMAVRDIPAQERVGYGGHWQADKPSRIATIPVGYGDGYPRTAKNGTPVLVGETLCPLAGRVSMDMITVDVTHLPSCEVGMPVELWGPRLSVNSVAECADTIGYELLTRITPRVTRRVIGP